MAKTIIKVESLGKKYRIGEKQAYYSLRDTIGNMFSAKKESVDEFWALKDINFEVKQGESIGIIGRNGAGKSTLLKILSRITPPTTGKITLEGRVASLLEVGTGFNPELTGRENIFLNGAILGMKQVEIKKKFDEIVAFSEVEKFLDMPVKHYSSGMYMRLAFAVAAHLDSEILIVDEVLAVGDAQFQKKCLGKMGEVTSKEGRTVLFVSHNMGAIQQLCQRGMLLGNGRIVAEGEAMEITSKYLKSDMQKNEQLGERRDRRGNGKIRFSKIDIESESERKNCIVTGKPFKIRLNYELADKIVENVAISLTINDSLASHVLAFWTETSGDNFTFKKKNGVVECEVAYCPLLMGQYYVNVYATVNGVESDYVVNALSFSVDDQEYFNKGVRDPEGHPKFVVNRIWKKL
ncbi:ABC transporter ATP-binding protein [Candidatus Shapirobacteria bacterium]|nr:ABC transporter ATP-binding protein [Candidatus Shapirobacteria bacterium]